MSRLARRRLTGGQPEPANDEHSAAGGRVPDIFSRLHHHGTSRRRVRGHHDAGRTERVVDQDIVR